MANDIMTRVVCFMRNNNDWKSIELVCKNDTKSTVVYYKKILQICFNGIKRYRVLKRMRNGMFRNYCEHLPILKWDKRFMGCTDYIDNIRPCDLTNPMMIGIDHFKRPFLTLAFIYKKRKDSIGGCITYFQRFSDTSRVWAWGGCSLHSCGSNRVDPDDVPRILTVLSNLSDDNDETFQLIDY